MKWKKLGYSCGTGQKETDKRGQPRSDHQIMKKKAIIFTILTSFLFWIYIFIGEKITLVTLEPIIVVRDLNSSLSGKPENVIATVPVGGHLRVTGCVDTKSYIIPKVRLTDGQIGYVHSGQFNLIREPGWSSMNEPNAFGC